MAKKQKSPEDFWREYEEKTGEKVIERSLGQYVSGWDAFGSHTAQPLWGLIIVTSGGFRFHHFPQASWLSAFIRGPLDDPPQEKTIFIPHDKIVSAVVRKETAWYRTIFSPVTPRLLISYRDDNGAEKDLVFLSDPQADSIAGALAPKNS